MNFFCFGDQRIVRDQCLSSTQNVFVTNDACFIDDEVGALSEPALRVENAVSGYRLEIRVIAEDGKIELEEVGKSLLRKRRVGADSDDFGIDVFKFIVVVATRRQLLDSRRREVENIKFDEHVFLALETA